MRLPCIKGRGLNAQRRSVSYEFTSGHGLQFYTTYPASGQISLFHENLPQERLIKEFQVTDVPSIYPGLSVRPFGRDSLYHEYAIRRRERSIPPRYDMRVSALDEYWPRSLFKLLQPIEIDRLRPYDKLAGRALVEEFWRAKKDWLHFERDGKAVTAAVPFLGNLGVFVCKSFAGNSPNTTLDGIPYWTWEDVEDYCREAKLAGKSPLGIEMKLMDSFVSFLLELFWSHRGGWYTDKVGKGSRARLRVRYAKGHSADGGAAALERFRRWIHEISIVEPYSTLSSQHPRRNKSWVFARHWYSTLVESVTRTKDKIVDADQDPLRIRSRDLRLLPIPIAKEHVPRKASSADFHSAWGDWHLGIWQGTENTELAIDLINTMISSRWQINSAITGAGLPLYESFFEEFGAAKCFGTNLSFNDVRKRFYAGAFSRGVFREFRFSMQRLYAAATSILNDGSLNSGDLWRETVNRIEAWRPSDAS